jgi:uncharacterized phage-associated protein
VIAATTTTASTTKKLNDAVAYVVECFQERQRAPLTRTKLVKYLYLADYTSCQQWKKPVTGLQYKSYYYGPYAPEILQAAESQPHYILYERYLRTDGAPYFAYRPTGAKPKYDTLSDEDRQTINHVLEKYGALSLKELLRTVYQTPPFQKAEMLQPIDLSS